MSFDRPDRNNVVVIYILNPGKYPLYDLELQIHDLDKMMELQKPILSKPDRTYIELQYAKSDADSIHKIGNIPPSSLQIAYFSIPPQAESRKYLVQTSARSGRTSTQLKYKKVGQAWKYIGKTIANGKEIEFGDADFPKDEKGKEKSIGGKSPKSKYGFGE